ncbi:MAG: porin family protein [Alphaproteobacteria bacterium]|nr:porin family protein [Alphaproteobacteria bacterium]
MKKFILMVMLATALPAVADEEILWDDYATAEEQQKFDNYVGIRLHKNERISFNYDIRDGAGTTIKDDNLGVGVVVGNRLADFLRIEFETMYNGLDDSKRGIDFDYDIWANMINVYLTREYENIVAPYVGVGIGFSTIWADVGGIAPHTSDTVFDLSYSIMAGVSFSLNERLDLDMGVKYQKYGDIDHETNNGTYATTDADATEFYIGAVYRFGLK